MDTVIQIKIVLKDIRPPVWRRVRVPTSLTLGELHTVIQAVMGWGDSHLHLFNVGDRVYGPIEGAPDLGAMEEITSAETVRLSDVVDQGLKTLSYTYDLGDDWRHVVTLEATKPAEPGVAYPEFVTGKCACPPEDVGGPPGYAYFLDIMADPDHPEYGHMAQWVGAPSFDPKALDRAAIEARLAPLQAPARKSPKGKAKPRSPSRRRDPSPPSQDGAIGVILAHLREGAEALDIPPSAIRQLIADPSTAAPLVQAVLSGEDPADEIWALLTRTLDDARMDAESEGARGPAFLAAVEEALERLIAETGPLGPGLVRVASAYSRADLPVPPLLTRHELPDTPLSPEELDALAADMDQSLGAMMAEVTDPRELRDAFDEGLASLPDEAKAEIVAHVSRRAEPAVPRLILYWLLHPAQDVRRAAAEALAERLSTDAADAPPMGMLVAVRRWMPADAARDTVDQALARARMGLATVDEATQRAHPPVLQALVSSVPDGAGAQHFVALVRQDDRLMAALVLLKAGHGVKDALVVEDTPENVQALFDRAAQLCHWTVGLDTLATAVGAALTECAALGRPPPAALVDVLEALPLDTLDPLPATPEAWVERADPDRTIADATPQLRGRLVNESADWHIVVPLVDCWFETSGALEAAVRSARSEAAARRAVYAHLEERRTYWAVLCFRAALVLQADMALRLAQSFVAVGLALLDGRPLKKIPIMDYVVGASLSAFDQAPMPDGEPDPEDGPVTLDPQDLWEAGPPDAGALRRLEHYLDHPDLSEEALTLPELDGYLHAVAVVDPAIGPETWLPPIWGGAPPAFGNPDQARDVVTTIFGRYAQILNALNGGDGEHSIVLGEDAPHPISVEDWAAGFVDGLHLDPSIWSSLGGAAAELLGPIFAAVDDPAIPAPPDLSADERKAIILTLPERAPALMRDLRRLFRKPGRRSKARKTKRR